MFNLACLIDGGLVCGPVLVAGAVAAWLKLRKPSEQQLTAKESEGKIHA